MLTKLCNRQVMVPDTNINLKQGSHNNMNTLSVYYCSFCEAVRKFLSAIIHLGENAGTIRAASQLSQMGYHKEAKALMMALTNKELK